MISFSVKMPDGFHSDLRRVGHVAALAIDTSVKIAGTNLYYEAFGQQAAHVIAYRNATAMDDVKRRTELGASMYRSPG